MKFAIITHTTHKIENDKLYAYEPYIREMNLWLNNVSEVRIVAPISYDKINKIESNYNFSKINISYIPAFNLITTLNKLKTIFVLPIIFFKVFKGCLWADHIHLRCPGNVGLIGCFVQVLFPFKKKTVKYAGNWDPKSKQPYSYRLQKWIVSNTFLTRNCKVLVYGEWKNQSINIIPFFTASYFEEDIVEVQKKDFLSTINIIFVGTFSKGKKPMLSVKTVEELKKQQFNVRLDMYGSGIEFTAVKEYLEKNNLGKTVFLHGNQPKEIVKRAFQKAHFLIFISKSEGWPKVVAEAMFWKCLPISSNVSCVNYMLDNGRRGEVVNVNINEIKLSEIIMSYFRNKDLYQKKVLKAQNWSQEFTLDKFEHEIQKLLSE